VRPLTRGLLPLKAGKLPQTLRAVEAVVRGVVRGPGAGPASLVDRLVDELLLGALDMPRDEAARRMRDLVERLGPEFVRGTFQQRAEVVQARVREAVETERGDGDDVCYAGQNRVRLVFCGKLNECVLAAERAAGDGDAREAARRAERERLRLDPSTWRDVGTREAVLWGPASFWESRGAAVDSEALSGMAARNQPSR
jgi:hypothetical protein